MTISNLLDNLPHSRGVKLIPFESVEIIRDEHDHHNILMVHGMKPCANLQVMAIPLTYVATPDYWEYEIVGFITDGFSLQRKTPFNVTISLRGRTGHKGITVIGANKKHSEELGSRGLKAV